MTTGLEPETALAYLRTLSTDLRAAAVLRADGTVLAGDAALARPHTGGEGRRIEARSDRHVVVVEAGPHALEGVLRGDLRTVLEVLDRR